MERLYDREIRKSRVLCFVYLTLIVVIDLFRGMKDYVWRLGRDLMARKRS